MNMSNIAHHIQFENSQTESSFQKTLELVDESCKEVRTISHQMMPNTLLKYGLASAIRDFISKIDTSKLSVNFDSYGLNERLDANTETILYRVLQEVVNNVIKHANANKLDIQISKDDDSITTTIEDNGKGFDTRAANQKDGIGLKNIRSRVEYLKGSVEFDSQINKGTVVIIWIPFDAKTA
jgi:signal transduction histidine kinase